MRVKGLDGKEYPWRLAGHTVLDSDVRERSRGHLRCRKLLEKLYPFDLRLEEVHLPGSGKLAADFVIPSRRLIVEVHGKQHYAYSTFLHGDRLSFYRSRERDGRKREWAELNNFRYVELPDTDTDDEWAQAILDRPGGRDPG